MTITCDSAGFVLFLAGPEMTISKRSIGDQLYLWWDSPAHYTDIVCDMAFSTACVGWKKCKCQSSKLLTFWGETPANSPHTEPVIWKAFPSSCKYDASVKQACYLEHRTVITSMNVWVNNGEAGDLRRHRAHHDVTVMWLFNLEHLG